MAYYISLQLYAKNQLARHVMTPYSLLENNCDYYSNQITSNMLWSHILLELELDIIALKIDAGGRKLILDLDFHLRNQDPGFLSLMFFLVKLHRIQLIGWLSLFCRLRQHFSDYPFTKQHFPLCISYSNNTLNKKWQNKIISKPHFVNKRSVKCECHGNQSPRISRKQEMFAFQVLWLSGRQLVKEEVFDTISKYNQILNSLK